MPSDRTGKRRKARGEIIPKGLGVVEPGKQDVRVEAFDPLKPKHNCVLCKNGAEIVEEMYLDWQPLRQICKVWNNKFSASTGYVMDKSMLQYHIYSMGLDVKKSRSVERGAMALVEEAQELMNAGMLRITGDTLINALTFLAKLEGRFSDGPTTNVIIRQNMQGLEEIASITDPDLLKKKAEELLQRFATVKVEEVTRREEE